MHTSVAKNDNETQPKLFNTQVSVVVSSGYSCISMSSIGEGGNGHVQPGDKIVHFRDTNELPSSVLR
jgi:hypothetical protein